MRPVRLPQLNYARDFARFLRLPLSGAQTRLIRDLEHQRQSRHCVRAFISDSPALSTPWLPLSALLAHYLRWLGCRINPGHRAAVVARSRRPRTGRDNSPAAHSHRCLIARRISAGNNFPLSPAARRTHPARHPIRRPPRRRQLQRAVQRAHLGAPGRERFSSPRRRQDRRPSPPTFRQGHAPATPHDVAHRLSLDPPRPRHHRATATSATPQPPRPGALARRSARPLRARRHGSAGGSCAPGGPTRLSHLCGCPPRGLKPKARQAHIDIL